MVEFIITTWIRFQCAKDEWSGIKGVGWRIELKLFGLTMDQVMFKGLHVDDNLRDWWCLRIRASQSGLCCIIANFLSPSFRGWWPCIISPRCSNHVPKKLGPCYLHLYLKVFVELMHFPSQSFALQENATI